MRSAAILSALAALLACVASACAADAPEPLPRAHAHNDYRHARPLLDALAHGFCSVEADIFLVDDRLLVAHAWHELDPKKQLTTLYLDPLLKRVEANGGRVYRHGPPFTLLIDVKSEAEATYARLHRVLADYAAMLTVVKNGNARPGAVTVVISGNRAAETLKKQRVRYAGLDGRLDDLQSDAPDHLMPLISDRWSSHFRWRGLGPIGPAERQKLRAIVAKAHSKGRRVRFWATPEREAVWRELTAAGVDLINTDDLAGLRRFLLSNR